MTTKAVILNESHYFKPGDLVEGVQQENGLIVDQHFLQEGNYVVLTEKLSSQDEEQVRRLIRDLLKRMLWRMYTRSAFILK